MHPRNPYRKPLDFPALAAAYPPLHAYLFSLQNRPTIDFSDADAQICLTKALLHRDFGLDVQLSPDRLCPPVRGFSQNWSQWGALAALNYILWIQDIIAATQDEKDAPILGIDIGTGASAIYPLLGCAANGRWAFVATELDPLSLRLARENIARNGFGESFHHHPPSRIEVLEARADGQLLLPLAAYPDRAFAFSMCNPPFYASAEEIAACAAGKAEPAVGARRAKGVGKARAKPGSRQSTPGSRQSTPGPTAAELPTALAGAPVEMVTQGGEVAFVARMVAESVQYGTRCRWYTSMLGKLSSVAEVIDNYAVTEFVQGQTRRWAVGWSFTATRLPDSLARISSQALQSVLPPRNEMSQPLPSPTQPGTSWRIRVGTVVRQICEALPGVIVREDSATPTFTIQATANTWSRAARRKAQREGGGVAVSEADGHAKPALTVTVDWTLHAATAPSALTDVMDWEGYDEAMGDAAAEYAEEPKARRRSLDTTMDVDPSPTPQAGAACPILRIRWVQGRDRALFETFWSHLSRKVVSMLDI
ncbi:hypothetical protein HDZ31DRAFT_44238 [Schizophyllum fasciatum]